MPTPKSSSDSNNEQIDLLRGGSVASSLTGAFGSSLRETRLTALLGYLIALNPKPYLELFKLPLDDEIEFPITNGCLGRSRRGND